MSEISGREGRYEREDGRCIGPAADGRGGPGKHVHAEQERGDGGNEKNGFGPAPLQLGQYTDRGQRHEDAGDKQEDSESEVADGEGRKRLHPPGVAEVGHGVVSAAVAASAIAGCVILFPAERALVQALVLLAAYPCFGALFYVGYRRWGPLAGGAAAIRAGLLSRWRLHPGS